MKAKIEIELEINSISDKKEWFIAYKVIVDKYSYILDRPETIYDYYTDEIYQLIKDSGINMIMRQIWIYTLQQPLM